MTTSQINTCWLMLTDCELRKAAWKAEQGNEMPYNCWTMQIERFATRKLELLEQVNEREKQNESIRKH